MEQSLFLQNNVQNDDRKTQQNFSLAWSYIQNRHFQTEH